MIAKFPDATIDNVAAVTAGDAWASGVADAAGPVGKQQPLILHWDGKSWKRVSIPAAAAKAWAAAGLTGSVVAASSSTNVWVIGARHYARLTRRGWVLGSLPGASTSRTSMTLALSAEALSTTNVWVFGVTLHNGSDALQPFAEEYNGHSWLARPVPGKGAIAAVSPLAHHSLLALVGSETYLGLTTSTPEVVRWNGNRWLPIAVQPHVAPTGFEDLTAMAVSAGHVWLVGNRQTGSSVFQLFAMELGHSAWKTTNLTDGTISGQDIDQGTLVPDGQGGLWALVVGRTSGSLISRLWHRTGGGTWTGPVKSELDKSGAALQGLAAVPGTESVWGTGFDTLSPFDGVIAVTGSVPH